jgi:sec-independent protein translocase protein TatA
MNPLIAFIGGIGPPEMLLVLAVLVLLFGADKIPRIARSIGSATGEFEKGRAEAEQELREGLDSVQQTEEPAAETDSEATAPEKKEEEDEEDDDTAVETDR